jgi:response regulator of citrate/malate metabolism
VNSDSQNVIVQQADRPLEAGKALMAFDSQMNSLIHTEGGLTFLWESSAWIKEWRIVIVSAASDERILKSLDTGISIWKVLSVPVNHRYLMEIMTEFLQGA